MKVYIVASNTSRTAIVIAGSKKRAEEIAMEERHMNFAEAYEINDYFNDIIQYAENTDEDEIWNWLEEADDNE